MRLAFLCTIAVPAMFFHLTAAHAQPPDPINTCRDYYTSATRNIRETQRENILYANLRTRMCNGKQVKSDFSLTSSAEIVLEGFPIKGGFGLGQKKERQEVFCQTHDEAKFSTDKAYLYESLIADRAHENFNVCVELASAGLFVKHEYVHPFVVTINFSLRGRPASLTSFQAGSGVTCTSPELKGSVKNEIYPITRDFAVTCKRAATASAAKNAKVFSRSYVSFTTNSSSRPYSILLPEDEEYSPALASEAKEKLDKLQQELTSKNEELDRLKQANAKFDAYSVLLFHGQDPNVIGTMSNNRVLRKHFKVVSCPKAGVIGEQKFRDGIRLSCEEGYAPIHLGTPMDYGGGDCGNTFHLIRCEKR